MTQVQFDELKSLIKTLQADTDECYKIPDILSEIEKLRKEVKELGDSLRNEIRDLG
jgi:hypothetical protein